MGGSGSDYIRGASGNDTIHGNEGNDQIRGDRGADLLFGEAGRDVISGGTGNDVLAGGVDDDSLFDSTGRGLMIGGAGDDVLNAGGGGHILIGGETLFDTDQEGLDAIRDEWASSRNFFERIANLSNDGASDDRENDDFFLRLGTEVIDDGDVDWLFGGGGRDWFFTFEDDEARKVSSKWDQVN